MNEELIAELIKFALKKKNEEIINIPSQNGTIKIAILQRGWVVIGRYFDMGEDIILGDSYVIRRWGTKKGLGQLAIEGKQEETILDKTGIMRFNKLTTIGFIDCNYSIWDKEI